MADEAANRAKERARGWRLIAASVLLLAAVIGMLCEAPWSTGGTVLLRRMITPAVLMLIVVLLLPGGIAAVRRK